MNTYLFKFFVVFENTVLYPPLPSLLPSFRTVIVLISVLGDIVVFHYSRQLDLYGEREEEVNLEDLKEQTEESKPLNTAKGDGGLEMGLQ